SSHVDDERVSAVNEVHCRSDCVSAELFVHEVEELEITDVARKTFNLGEAVIHPRQIALALLTFFRRWFTTLAALGNRVVRIAHAQVLVMTDGLQIVRELS